MKPGRSIGARVSMAALSVMLPATVALGASAWGLMRHNLFHAVDAHLLARIDGVRRYIEQIEHDPAPEDLKDELTEYGELSEGDAELEVIDASGRVLCGPLVPGWDASAIETRLSDAALGAPVFSLEHVHRAPFRVAGERVQIGSAEYRIVSALPMGPSTEALSHFAWTLAGAAPVVLIAAGLGSFWISRRALAPVDRITRAVRGMTVRDLDRRLDVPAVDDEVTRLITTFNDMIARVEGSVVEMARFTADAAHELRTPVTLIRTTAEIALSRDRPSDDYRVALSDVLVQSEQMSSLVTDLLDLARTDASARPEDHASVDFVTLAATVAREIVIAASSRGLTVDVDIGDASLPVAGDAQSLRRMLLVILDNAVKYSHPGGRVRLVARASEDQERVLIDVIDAGIGIPAEDRARVFDRFYRSARAREHSIQGSGLGLSIARLIVVRHGGSIEIDAGDDGRGSRVRVELPRERRAAVGDPMPPATAVS